MNSHHFVSSTQELEVVDDQGRDLDKRLLRSYYLKRSKQGRRFPPRMVGVWFEEG